MRGIYSSVTDIRRKVFTEVARLAYEGGDYSRIEELPYKIVPGVATYRDSIFLERAIVGERLRLSIGLPVRPLDAHAPISEGIEESAIAEKYYDPPLVNVIKFACNSCPEKRYYVTDGCQGCLAHPCTIVCPKGAVSIKNGKSFIDDSKCIKCGRCHDACSYNAIIKQERPCAAACGMDAISSDPLGRATIDYDKCVSCGQCIVNCPFGAISDKGQIFQIIHAIKKGERVIVAIAPSYVGQFGPKATPEKIITALKKLGFDGVVEVAIGADFCTIDEANDFVKKVPAEQPFMATSCCPAWSVMAKKCFPEFAPYISMSLTPMVLTARMIKKIHKDCKVVFIGPCSAKKLEASRRTIRSDVDFVLTFEELMGMFAAKDIDPEKVEVNPEDLQNNSLDIATAAGRGFAVSNGVSGAVADIIREIAPEREVKIMSAQGLRDCKKMLQLAKAGRYDGYLLEGMGCPGGCVAGAGTIQSPTKAATMVGLHAKKAEGKTASDNPYKSVIDELD